MKGAARLLCCSIPFGVLYVQSEGNGDGCHGDAAMTVLGVISALPACAGDSSKSPVRSVVSQLCAGHQETQILFPE